MTLSGLPDYRFFFIQENIIVLNST